MAQRAPGPFHFFTFFFSSHLLHLLISFFFPMSRPSPFCRLTTSPAAFFTCCDHFPFFPVGVLTCCVLCAFPTQGSVLLQPAHVKAMPTDHASSHVIFSFSQQTTAALFQGKRGRRQVCQETLFTRQINVIKRGSFHVKRGWPIEKKNRSKR